jgi:hypothetical protein
VVVVEQQAIQVLHQMAGLAVAVTIVVPVAVMVFLVKETEVETTLTTGLSLVSAAVVAVKAAQAVTLLAATKA